MGATASSSGRCEEDEAEELAVTAAASEAQGDGSADDKVEYIKSVSSPACREMLHKLSKTRSLNLRTRTGCISKHSELLT